MPNEKSLPSFIRRTELTGRPEFANHFIRRLYREYMDAGYTDDEYMERLCDEADGELRRNEFAGRGDRVRRKPWYYAKWYGPMGR